ncbi:hypothetical protein F511_18064 [Dorcoceras hygrometricum]|uniref:J domain-containing protein n=1 Tax=Dorcoceras hygrometricum TaxID=472368 RepID=A0A2Z7CBV2_9LAMI|nr:hypothetical protein F511_18064 [Dorcoceras hygrometricum]
MRGASIGHSHYRPSFGRKTLRKCRNSEEADDVILIDVDPDHSDNVIILDVPDSLPAKRQGSSILREDKSRPLQSVIYIDDDESPKFNSSGDDEITDKFNSFAGASSSRNFKPPAEDCEDVDAEEHPFIQENVTPVRLSKCKRTYSGKASAGKGCGLNLDSKTNSCDNDNSDCELMEDISGKVQEQWEKAFYRRKKGIKNDRFGIRSQNTASRIMNDNRHQTVGSKGENDKHMEAPYHFDIGKFSKEDEGTSPLSEEDDACYDSTNASVVGSSYRGQHSPSTHTEPEDHQYFEPGSSSCHNRKRFKKSSHNPVNVFPTHEFRESLVTATGCVDEMEHLESCDPLESGSVEETHNLTSVRCSTLSSTLQDKQKNCSFSSSTAAVESVFEDSPWFQNSSLGSRDGINTGCQRENMRTIDVIPLSRNIHVQLNDAKVGRDESVSDSGEEEKDVDSHPESGHAPDFGEGCMLGEREKFKETAEYKSALEEEWASRQQALKIQAEEAQHLRQLQKRSKAENGHTMDSAESCMIGEREKFKETDEYKRAMEEEWASRQQTLKIQAEEAQHLRRLLKRRKAENMRLVDMERRQKERIEEMRSTQKKDEENMNLKEVIRADVRKELSKLEMVCQNMASLLHSFGIQVEGWPNPSQQEVQTAYKKALLTFHPDRALRTDIHQQVEAEEKFKLINRFKEKFSSLL